MGHYRPRNVYLASSDVAKYNSLLEPLSRVKTLDRLNRESIIQYCFQVETRMKTTMQRVVMIRMTPPPPTLSENPGDVDDPGDDELCTLDGGS